MIVQKTYGIVEKLSKIMKSKLYQNVLIFLITTFAFFGMFNAYAAVEDDSSGMATISVEDTYIDTVETVSSITETESENVQSLDWKNTTAKTINIGVAICPQCYDTYENLAKNPNVSPSTKAGFVGMANDGLKAMMYNPPSIDIGSHLAREWVPGYEDSNTSAYAGGYEELQNSGVESIWIRTRNIAYLFFVVVMIVAGFMIMFRNKLGGQTMVTLGNVLPNIIVALILVTFSFAIVGLIIDFGAVLCNVVVDLLYGADSTMEVVNTNNPFSLVWRMWSNAKTIRTEDFWADPVSAGSIMDIVVGIGVGWLNPVTAVASGALQLAGIKINLITIITSGIMLFGAVKVWIALLKSYISILIGVITGPIMLALSAIPGQSMLAGNWFKSILRNVLVFPVVLAMVNLPFALWGENVSFLGLPVGLTTPGAGLGEATGGVGLDMKFLVAILKIVMLFMAAQAPKFLEAMLPPNTPKPVAEGMANAKESFSKIPLIGKLFG